MNAPIKKIPNYIEFSNPRLAALYDTLNPFSNDTEFFCKQAEGLSARTIIDLGCGTGLLTCELEKRGHEMVGIEPAEPMLAIAQAKSNASSSIKWLQGSFEQMDGLHADMILMTSHVAQFFLDEQDWKAMLQAARKAIEPNGRLVFDIRRLTNPPFPGWPTEDNRKRIDKTPLGSVDWWFKLLDVKDKRVSYELHYFLTQSSEKIVSVFELIFRSQDEITNDLSEAGFVVEAIYGDFDGKPVTPTSTEMIFITKNK